MIKQVFSFLSIWLEKRVGLLMVAAGIITIMAAFSAGITAITGIYTISSISIVVLGIGTVILIALRGREYILFQRTCKSIDQNCKRAMEKHEKLEEQWDKINKRIST